MYYLNSRYYNPEWGRFINADALGGEIGKLLSPNIYAYCRNNPISRIDPDGYRDESGCGGGSIEDFAAAEFEGYDLIGGKGTTAAGKGEVTGRLNMSGKTHPVSGVEFDNNGFPKFESHYDMNLEPNDYLKSRSTHFNRASKALYNAIKNSPKLTSKFTQSEINIFKEGNVPKRFTWHHNQKPGLMQLVDRVTHRLTGHEGGFNIWGPGN